MASWNTSVVYMCTCVSVRVYTCMFVVRVYTCTNANRLLTVCVVVLLSLDVCQPMKNVQW